MAARRAQVYWLCQIAGWSSWSVIGMAYGAAGPDPLPPWHYWPAYLSSIVSAIAWTHLYRGLIRRRGWTALAPGKLFARALPASVVLGIVIPYSTLPLYLFLYPQLATLFGMWVLPAVTSSTWCVVIWNVAYFGVHYFERWRQAELDKLQLAVVAAEARLHGLMSQIHPHFLFNSLNSVRALIVEDPVKAQAAVTALSELMRYAMHATKIATVSLDTELEMVRNYLSLQEVRLDERLTSRLDIADDARAVQVPTMLVQELVENGVKHGVERLPAGGAIGVAAWLDGDQLRVRVTSSGKIAEHDGSNRVGLANARERLRLLYGDRASLALREDDRGVVADLVVPVAAAPAVAGAA